MSRHPHSAQKGTSDRSRGLERCAPAAGVGSGGGAAEGDAAAAAGGAGCEIVIAAAPGAVAGDVSATCSGELLAVVVRRLV